MKKYIFIITAVISVFLTSCQQEAIPTYSGTDQIYFSYADKISGISNFELINFGYDRVIKQDSTIAIDVTVQGSITNYDRPVNFTMLPSSLATLGQDIVLLPEHSFVPAGKKQGKIYIKLYNTERLNDNTFAALLALAENEHFKADYHLTSNQAVNNAILEGKTNLNSTEFYVFFDNNTEKPNWWANVTFGMRFDMIFGAYSKAKFKLMCEVLPGCSREYFTYEGTPTATELNTMFSTYFPMGLLAAWSMTLSTWLNDYKEKNGVPYTDENGVEIKGGTMYN